MAFTSEECSFRIVSEIERKLAETGEDPEMIGLARDILGCQRRRECGDADCCTILGAALMAEYGGHVHD